MSDELDNLLDALLAGDLDEERHRALQDRLLAERDARDRLRERVDLEAALRTWAAEPAPAPAARRVPYARLALAAALLLALAAWWLGPAADPGTSAVGTVRFLAPPVWRGPAPASGARFAPGPLALEAGLVALAFDTGAELLLEGPCALEVLGPDAARLASGQLSIALDELCDGFALDTPEARIVDLGTRFGVAVDEAATEVHVFAGRVSWQPAEDSAAFTEIAAGEALRFARGAPRQAERIAPPARRRFVRALEEAAAAAAAGQLLAYDGFENLAGQLQRGRSGFGWASGWLPGRRRRGSAEVQDAPADTVFGVARGGRRLLSLTGGKRLSRPLEAPLLITDAPRYVSFLVARSPGSPDAERYLEVALGAAADTGRRRQHRAIACGLGSDGFPFLKAGGRIVRSAPALADGPAYLFVLKLSAGPDGVESSLRVYAPGEHPGAAEPQAWSARAPPVRLPALDELRLAVGEEAEVALDELRIGAGWGAVGE